MKKPKTEKTPESVPSDWADTPAVNPRYKGATPTEVARALLRKPVQKSDADPRPVKSTL